MVVGGVGVCVGVWGVAWVWWAWVVVVWWSGWWVVRDVRVRRASQRARMPVSASLPVYHQPLPLCHGT